ncbi:hypothetical protein [Tenacibaculum aiptasiae]|uniref:hypothetical protein n=1 Tax=Tenacibaculum aiptasiae TaxID=426481 RepID=UPI002331435F|nr:hypothetical protein [Tenacibaculum aiptasiae]
MRLRIKSIMLFSLFVIGMLFSTNAIAQSSCCGEKKSDEVTCTKDNTKNKKTSCKEVKATDATSGCTPSACRGAKTKFGEAKVITNLRKELIGLKANMEKSTKPKFDSRSYDIHGIVGKSDEESLQIIVKEVNIVERAFSEKLNYKMKGFTLPKNKAQQIVYLSERIASLNKLL